MNSRQILGIGFWQYLFQGDERDRIPWESSVVGIGAVLTPPPPDYIVPQRTFLNKLLLKQITSGVEKDIDLHLLLYS